MLAPDEESYYKKGGVEAVKVINGEDDDED